MLVTEKICKEVQEDGSTKYYLRTRKFLGETEDFESDEIKNFQKAHLKAYLKGQPSFKFRLTNSEGIKIPATFPVLEDIHKKEITQKIAEEYIDRHNRKNNNDSSH